jgi:hypothetical protein
MTTDVSEINTTDSVADDQQLTIDDSLMIAAATADIPAMKAALKDSPLSLYYRDPVTGASPLHIAAKTGSIEALQVSDVTLLVLLLAEISKT